MISEKLYEFARSDKSVSSELAKNPQDSPGRIAHRLYGHIKHEGVGDAPQPPPQESGHDAYLQRALECGKWGNQRPTDLFLKCYYDALLSLEHRPLAGLVSPSLMGSSGVVPLTIISTLPDINRHTANCIVRAKKEVFLATNFWIHSDASMIITNALRELSRRAGERGERVVVKIIYDRGSLKQLYENHQHVSPAEWTGSKVQLPAPEEIPNIDMEVINYHRPMLGTFHAKLCVIDRKIGLLQSNNVQDNDNLEMMSHLEGPIVDAMYDLLLISWNKHFNPPLPMIGSPAAGSVATLSLQDVPEFIPSKNLDSPSFITLRPEKEVMLESTSKDPHYDSNLYEEAKRVNSQLNPSEGETGRDATARHLNKTTLGNNKVATEYVPTNDGPDISEDDEMVPYILPPQHEAVPMALISREPNGTPHNSNYPVPQNAAWLAAIANAQRSIFIQTPNMNAEPILKALLTAVKRGISVTAYVTLGYNDGGELLPGQNGTNEMVANRLYSSLESDEHKSRLKIYNYIGKDQKVPVHNKWKYRSSHVKLMIVDDAIAIQGNGNLDTQSYYHSTEVNILIDSPVICKAWRDAIERNQNTSKYGLVDSKDGCWHDPDTGAIPEGSIGSDPGRFSWAKGVVGAVQRVRGVGGF
ncbi:IQ calmodulin-binding motif protein [Talaromyces proteolyticus]|uniref:IQ calmodulin-binding motif protein n=1 Tax=Talaromyces proteolyticus TaxID=1131652 RepID=A0AAD4L0E9_9EURO|nr:IQ calmodulin-binding motif protein [Talaromyces proteolyticus]KAH8701565.1 IQ calmodulin-binding motif protein [Talaromyces proteolyticus]